MVANMPLDDALLADARAIRDRLLDLRHETDRAQSDFSHAVRRLHASGGSLREIAQELGLSHQRVHQIVEGQEGSGPTRGRPFPGRPWGQVLARRRGTRDLFERFSGASRDVLGRAQEEARDLGHDYLGTEHLLLALAAAPDEHVARALAECRLTPDRVRDGVLLIVGRGSGAEPGSPRRLTPRLKRVLELAVREAGTGSVEPGHLLLGLAGEGEGVAAKMLSGLGCPDLPGLRGLLATLSEDPPR